MANYEMKFRLHAVQRMFERGITDEDVKSVVESGEIIQEYADDQPYPSRLMLGWIADRPLHVVAADNHADKETIIVTAYEPDSMLWESDFRRRRT